METTPPIPDVPAAVLPRRDATSDDLKALGLALAVWSEAELEAGGLLSTIDNIVVAELLGGDDPTDYVFALLHGEDDSNGTGLHSSSPHADSVEAARRLIVACSFRGSAYNRHHAVASLRAAVPAILVEDVLIDGRSWNLSD